MATGTSYHTRLGSPPANGWTPPEITLKAVTGKQSAGMKEVTAAHPLANFQRHAATLEIQPKLYFARENERLIGRYLSRFRQLNPVMAPKEGFETQLRASCMPITCRMGTLGMTRQISDSCLQRIIELCPVPR